VLHEILVEEFAHQAFGEHVLDEHFVDGGLADIGVERLAANLHEVGMGPLEALIVGVRIGDAAGEPIGERGNFLAEVGDGFFEARKGRHLVIDERLEYTGGSAGVCEAGPAHFEAILKEHEGLGVFEEHVAKRVATLAFELDFFVEVVVAVLCLPVGVGQAELVTEHAVVVDGVATEFLAVFFDEGPLFGFAELVQQARKSAPEGTLGAGALGAQLGHGGSICGQRLLNLRARER